MSMSKTGKKLKSVDCDNIDLTFNEIYDVFIDSEEYEFIIDDIGDKRYVYVHDKDCYELVDDVDLDKERFMSDCTKSNYTKTGKKVKCVYSGRIDLIYKKVYDVLIDVNGDEFVIDEAGDWRYDSMEFPLWCEVFNDVASATNTANNVSTTNGTDDGTKPKFKVGDTVKVTSIEYICQYDKNIKVGDVGVITEICSDKTISYCVFDWYFPEDDLELVDENTSNKKYNPLVVQQSGNHYKNGEIQPIEYSERNNLSTCQGNIVKYITRHKEKNGVDDLAKIVHYALLEALFVYGKDGATELRDKIDSLINIKK